MTPVCLDVRYTFRLANNTHRHIGPLSFLLSASRRETTTHSRNPQVLHRDNFRHQVPKCENWLPILLK